jgi:hypothetical protein
VVLAVALLTACSDSPVGPELVPSLTDPPPDIAGITFTAEGRPTSPYVLLEIHHEDGFRGFLAVNGESEPVWFHRTVGGPSGHTRRANGNFVFLDSERGLVEVTAGGEVVQEVPQEGPPGRFHHDVTATSDGTVLFLARDTRPWPDTLVTGDAIWEWVPETGALDKRWSSFDHLVPEVDRSSRSVTTDWLHANSLSVGPRGNVVVSLHFIDQVISLTPDFLALEWRLGGVGATLTVDDPFSGQHTAVEVETNRVLVFDNGFDRETERYSRAAEYELRPDGTARLAWEWRPERDNWARVISSARRLPNGNTLVAFGLRAIPSLGTTGPLEVYEVTEGGEVVWHLVLDGLVGSMYRATPIFELEPLVG